MRVCMLHNHYYRSSGSAIVIRRIAEAFAGTDIDFFFAGCEHGAPEVPQYLEDRSWMAPDRYQSFGLMCGAPTVLAEMLRFGQWIKEAKCDLIHVHHRRLAVLANLVSKIARVPVLYTAHNTFPWAAWFWAGAPASATGVSPSVVQYLKRSTRVRNLYLSWNPYPFHAPAGPDVRSMRALTVGRLEPVKGHLHLIRAWRRLLDNGVRAYLDIFGEGRMDTVLASEIKRLELNKYVSLKGYCPSIASLVPNYAFNVLVSQTEGFPNVVVEAASCGVASLLTDVDGSRDTLPADRELPNGVPYGSSAELASVLEVWFNSPKAVEREGIAFFKHLESLCSIPVVRSQYEVAYRACLA